MKIKRKMLFKELRRLRYANVTHFNEIRTLDGKIQTITRTLKLHGEAHMAQDIQPEFKQLKEMVDMHLHRLADHDESIEALCETVDQLSTCKCQAGEQMLKRIAALETRMDVVTKGDLTLIAEHVDNLEESNRVFLKSIPEIEILKTRVIGLVRDVDALQIRLSRAQDMIAEMQRDSRILKSPGYKKEIAAQKQDAKSKKAKSCP